jgi:hypothetical protein
VSFDGGGTAPDAPAAGVFLAVGTVTRWVVAFDAVVGDERLGDRQPAACTPADREIFIADVIADAREIRAELIVDA